MDNEKGKVAEPYVYHGHTDQYPQHPPAYSDSQSGYQGQAKMYPASQAGQYPPAQYPSGQYQPGPGQYPPVQQYAQQQQQTNVVVVGQPTVQTGIVYTNPAPPNYLGLAIFSCLCCFWPTGICAIVAATNASSAAAAGDMTRANSSANNARNLSIASIVVGVIWITLVIVLRVVLYSSYNSYGY